MAYEVKYRIQVATQAESTVMLNVLEQDYTGGIIIYDATAINIQYIPSSDDPFEPIIASQLSVSIDVTDFIDDMPNLVSLNDRKYLCKLYDSNISMEPIWVGWILTDSVQFPFTTGIKEISFNAICGLGMLNYIQYQSISTSTITKYSLKEIIINCLNRLEFDTNLNLFTACSLYSSQMLDRTDGDEYEPFAQTYISYNSIQDNGTFKSCLQILRDILTSFGCRIIQSNGEWNILQINQQANEDNYYTRYDNAGTVIDSGTYSKIKNIPDDGLFIGNSQVKILQKGFNKIISNNKLNYNDNLLYNGDFKYRIPEDPGDPRYDIPDGWDTDFTVNGINWAGMTKVYTGQYDTVALVGGPGTAELIYEGSIFINEYEEIQLSLIPYSSDLIAYDNVTFKIAIVINSPTGSYYYDNNNSLGTEYWQPFSPPLLSGFNVNNIPTNKQWQKTLLPAPAKGMITLKFYLEIGSTQSIGLSNINLQINNQIEAINITAQINSEYQYNKEVSIPFGLAPKVSGKYSFNGYLSNAEGEMLLDWYMMERPTDIYYSLAELTVKNISNLFLKNIENVDSTIELYGVTGNEVLTFTDIDPEQISTENKYYIIGNNTYQYNVQELQGTMLEISNVNNGETIVMQDDIYPELTIPPYYVRKITGARNTSIEACIVGPLITTIYSPYITLIVGEYVYTDSRCTIPYNGNAKYYGIFYEERFKTRYIQINTDGKILSINDC